MTELLIRSITECEMAVRSGSDGRTLTGLVALWDTEIQTEDEMGKPIREVIRRGAFNQTIRSMGDKVTLSLYHPSQLPHSDQQIVGKAVDWAEDARGQRASFRLAKTARADEALEMVREGLIDQFSIGFRSVPSRTRVTPSTKRGMPSLHERSEVNLRHVALVPSGAFGPDAGVESIRAITDNNFTSRKQAEDLLALLAEITKPT